MTTPPRRTSYWSRPTPQADAYPPLDFTVCWARGCDESAAAAQDSRLRGTYCQGHVDWVAKSVEREGG